MLKSFFEDLFVAFYTALVFIFMIAFGAHSVYALVVLLPFFTLVISFAATAMFAVLVLAFARDVNSIKKSAKVLKEQTNELKLEVSILESNNNHYLELNKAHKKSNEKYKALNNSLKTEVNILEFNNNESKAQIEDLTRLLENSKKLVTNLVLAGDDYKKFNKKFGGNLEELGQTSTDLRDTAKSLNILVGKMTNSLAKQSRAPNPQVSLDCGDLPSSKLKRLKSLAHMAN